MPPVEPLPSHLSREVAALRHAHDVVVDEALRQSGVTSTDADEDPMRESLDQAVHAAEEVVRLHEDLFQALEPAVGQVARQPADAAKRILL